MSEKHIYKKYALHNFKKKNEEEKLNGIAFTSNPNMWRRKNYALYTKAAKNI